MATEKKAEAKSGATVETPLMKQYYGFKAQYPDALLLFRIGDFYETFGEDAIKASSILGIVLTKRANGSATYIELAGFPHHSLETYLPKLVRAGLRVAICEQLEDPKLTKKIVKRGVTELVSPGLAYSDRILEHKQNNFLAALHLGKDRSGIALVDVSTGEFLVGEGNTEFIDKLLQGFAPSEIVLSKPVLKQNNQRFSEKYFTSGLDEWVFQYDHSREQLLKHFNTKSLKGFGIDEMQDGIVAAGAIFHYLKENQHDKLGHINTIARLDEGAYLWLDRFTIRNLELLSTAAEQGHPLIEVIDDTHTAMGARLLRRWLLMPLRDIKQIEARLEAVDYFYGDIDASGEVAHCLHHIGDLERLITKVSVGKCTPREVLQLSKALKNLVPIKEKLAATSQSSLIALAEQLNPCAQLREHIELTLHEDPPVSIQKGNVIAKGISEELDELRGLAFSGKDYLLQLQQREIERTGITSLKVSFNNVFGYYLEVTNSHKDKVPSEWIRKQTLVNAERYITEELKTYEEKILGAEENILALETSLYQQLLLEVVTYIPSIQHNAQLLAQIDCLLSLGKVALRNNYVRPKISDTKELKIVKGRHPVIERFLPSGEEYVPNDIYLDDERQQIIIITGPNMAGKSALLRQTALIVIMAQLGSYVPAKSADIGLVDRVFTRVGASDNLSQGESTFMVEMTETASIMNNLSPRSLVLLDEIGRGTSTYDGISIAWAIAEHLHQHPSRPKTLFATHYHELNELAELFPRTKNFNVSVKELDNKVIFLRKLIPGGSEHSFGIHVAKMAGIPQPVVNRAWEILRQLESSHSAPENSEKVPAKAADDFQLSFFQLDDPLLEQIREDILSTDINTLTPVEALMKLNEIKGLLKKKKN